jgi:hypothetical protein
MMSNSQAREALERYFDKPLTDSQWHFLVDKGYEDDLLAGKRRADEVAKELKEWWGIMGAGPAGAESARPEMAGKRYQANSDKERRQQAVSYLLAKDAEALEEVDGFRRTYLPDGLLPWEKMEAWILAQAREAGVATRFVEVPSPSDLEIRGDNAKRALVFEPELRVSEVPGEVGVAVRWGALKYGTPDKDYIETVLTVAGSMLDRLRKTSERLSRRYQWTPEQATVFVLTGEPPLHCLVRLTRAVKTTLPVVSRIELSVDPAVTPEDLAEFYRAARQRMMPGRRHRAQDRKALELAKFSAGRDESEPWEETLRVWNETIAAEHSGWQYNDKQKRNFPRDMKMARERLLFPAYVDPAAGSRTATGDSGEGVVDVTVQKSGEDDA